MPVATDSRGAVTVTCSWSSAITLHAQQATAVELQLDLIAAEQQGHGIHR